MSESVEASLVRREDGAMRDGDIYFWRWKARNGAKAHGL